MIGDSNIHDNKWLRFPYSDTTIRTKLKTFCDFHGLFQIVRKPTRHKFLLILAITGIPKSTATVYPIIANHNAVLVQLPLPEVFEKSFTRAVWDLRRVDSSKIEHELTVFDWSSLRQGTAEESLNYFLEVLWNLLIKYIPRKDIVSRKSTHPWLNERCRNALVQKNGAERTSRFEAERFRCIQIFGEERAKQLKLQNLRRHNKQWWRINRELFRKKASMSSVPTRWKWMADR